MSTAAAQGAVPAAPEPEPGPAPAALAWTEELGDLAGARAPDPLEPVDEAYLDDAEQRDDEAYRDDDDEAYRDDEEYADDEDHLDEEYADDQHVDEGLFDEDAPEPVDPEELAEARAVLAALVERADAVVAGGELRPGPLAPRADTGPASAMADLTLARELADAAADVFALAMRAERAVEAAAEPVSSLTELESAVGLTAIGAAAGVGVPGDARLAGLAAEADSWPNGRIPLSALCSPDVAPTYHLRCDAAAALDRLAAAYRAGTGKALRVTSAYRTYERQVQIKAVHGGLAAAPGSSNHGRGVAVDLADMGGLGNFDAPGYLWMKAHAAGFGWYHPPIMEPGGGGPQEPWHWEFGTDSGYDDRARGDADPRPRVFAPSLRAPESAAPAPSAPPTTPAVPTPPVPAPPVTVPPLPAPPAPAPTEPPAPESPAPEPPVDPAPPADPGPSEPEPTDPPAPDPTGELSGAAPTGGVPAPDADIGAGAP
ncbi:D-alanyl-D-alanine carboxypeptidase family protein [Actinotalea ferrariae]|nr:D-alanyl-D-alanine carboxypeptidase family protein [Actinotalea ferrariae]